MGRTEGLGGEGKVACLEERDGPGWGKRRGQCRMLGTEVT